MNSLYKPIDIRYVATDLGWHVSNEPGEPIFIFSNPNFPRRQIIIPKRDNAPDYIDASLIALEKLSELHNLSFSQIAYRVKSTRDDTMRYRITTPRVSDDSIPLDFAAELIKGAELVLLSSACTVLKPQTHHLRLSVKEAQELVSKSRLGQTEEGSYIIKVSCPVNAMDIQATLNLDTETTYVRSTMLAVKNGIKSLINAIEDDELNFFVDDLKASPTPEVSSNLCEALTRLYDPEIDNNVDLSFQWSPVISIAAANLPHETLRIRSEYFGLIEQVRRELRSVERAREDTFVGTVEQLNGDMGDEGRRSGEVIFGLLIDGTIVRAKTILDATDYEKAAVSHLKEQLLVRFEGTLLPGRQPRLLTSVKNFGFIDPTSAQPMTT